MKTPVVYAADRRASPYTPRVHGRKVAECYKGIGMEVTQETTRMTFYSAIKDEIARVIKPRGKVICFGWCSNGIGKKRGFRMTRVLLVPHGGHKNDTIITVERKHQANLKHFMGGHPDG